jgi:hypothetical protein
MDKARFCFAPRSIPARQYYGNNHARNKSRIIAAKADCNGEKV